MRPRFPLSFLCLMFLAVAPEVARAACAAGDLDQFVAKAQTADKAALAVGRELIKCPTLRDRALYWQAFLLAQTGSVAESRKLDDPNPGKTTSATREGILARARAGQFKDLKARVDDQEPGYANSPEALLVLARVLTRKGEFAAGREAYLAYLRLAPDQDDVEAELLYGYLWEGNHSEADSRFANAARYPLRAPMAQAVQRGKALAQKRLADAPKTKPGAERPLRGLYKLELGAHHATSVYQRRSARATYEGPVDVAVAAHSFDVQSLETYKARASEARFGAHGTLGQTFLLKAHVGYFSPGDDHLIGDAAFGLALFSDLVTEIGANREPLALTMPLIQDDLDLMRDILFASIRYGRWVELRSELRKEKDYAAHELHRLLGRVPILSGEGGGAAVGLRFPVGLELHPNPSPNYASEPKTLSIGAGAELSRDYSSRWALDFVLDYAMESVTLRGTEDETKNVGVLSVLADVKVPLDDTWKLTGGFRYFRADEEDDVYTRDRLSGVVLGLAYEDPR